jgi:hypothetical protein
VYLCLTSKALLLLFVDILFITSFKSVYSLSNGLSDTRRHIGSICGITKGHSGPGTTVVTFDTVII